MSENLKRRIRQRALELGFEDAGITGVEPLDIYIQEIQSRPHMYAWVNHEAFSTLRGASPSDKYPWACSILVLIRNYHRMRFPDSLLGRFGRCYQVDERKLRGEEYGRFKAFLDFLKLEGIQARFDGEIPARMTAARAGITSYGKNCFAYARKTMKKASWLESIPLVLDAALEPDEPNIELGCPPGCENLCMEACPTGALYEPLKMNPSRCIAFQTYYGPELTPKELRGPMSTWIYGCDRCQEACPRNRPWLKQELPVNEPLEARAPDFEPSALLTMSQVHYEEKVWPQFFYISRGKIDRWHMNAARALGNSDDSDHIPLLAKTLSESPFENVRAMCAWSLGRLKGPRAKNTLEKQRASQTGIVREEIEAALGECS
jgi:epoxyqueuosine reductase